MTTVRDVLLRDPTKITIPNLGVAKLGHPSEPGEWDVLRYEVQRFVCEGEYRRGLDNILSTFLGHLGRGQQPAAWVSGFYGSGKSHFVRVLDSLWRDIAFPEGARARGLVTIPDDISAHLKELSTAGQREGGLWSASGTLSSGAGNSVRLAMLHVIFRSAGLPAEYPPAKFVLWLKKEGHFDALAAAVARRGKSLDDLLANMYVSTPLAEAILEAIPGFAVDTATVRMLLAEQYPMKSEIGGDEFISTLEEVLALQSTVAGKLPLTLLVFDELQQFLVGDLRRIMEVQEVVQDCTARFDSRVLFVATGQMALSATADLQRLQDRFSVKVALSDADVEKVVREVVLRKDPDKIRLLQETLDAVGGEVGRHLGGTAIAASASDGPDLVPDYPLLPTRRRLWEAILGHADPTGTKGQLRAQLTIVHDATAAVADRPLGWAIPADALYWGLESFLQQNGVLPRQTAATIREQEQNGADGHLRARICALVFLIGQLDTEAGRAAGVKATVDVLADLLVEDLKLGSATLRRQLPDVLRSLAESGVLLQVGDEYRLQTKESAEWEQDFRRHLAGISSDPGRISEARSTELRKAIGAALAPIKPLHGDTKVSRKVELHFGDDPPPSGTGGIPVWIRDGWSTTESLFRDAAQRAGVDSPVVFIFLPRARGDDLANAIAGELAATATVSARPTPTTQEGRDARASIESRGRSEREKTSLAVQEILAQAHVFQGGGNEVVGKTFDESVRSAIEDAKARLFPRFAMADDPRWGKVRERAHAGDPAALAALGYQGDADQHPVCKLVLDFVGPAGKRGSEVQKHFLTGEYGWPQDAPDGAILVLVAGGFMTAKLNGQQVHAKQIPQNQIRSAEFRSEVTVVQTPHRLAIRKLAAAIQFPLKNGEETEAIRPILDRLTNLAARAGGNPPLPSPPDTGPLRELEALAGNEQFVAVAEKTESLIGLHEDWSRREKLIAERKPRWEQLQRLIRHAAGLPIAEEIGPRIEAVEANRTLLDNPDPVAPLIQDVSAALREALTTARERFVAAHNTQAADLSASPDWQKLAEQDRDSILAGTGLTAPPDVHVGDPEALLGTLDVHPIEDWDDKLAALPERIAQARELAARKLQPSAVRVTPRGATLATAGDVDAYLDDLRRQIMAHIETGSPVII